MTKLSSLELVNKIELAGIKYVPADQIYYKVFPYKVELSPKFKGLGTVNGKRGCQIDVSRPAKARRELEAFNIKIEKVIENVEHREEIKLFVERLPAVEYKHRLGGENSLFYFRDAATVMTLIERYPSVINSVTGPINNEHENVFSEKNVIVRDTLYHGKFRYVLEFDRSREFAEETALQLLSILHELDPSVWRCHGLDRLISYYKNVTAIRSWRWPPSSVKLYLSNPNDYVYFKLLAGEHVTANHEVKLFDELN